MFRFQRVFDPKTCQCVHLRDPADENIELCQGDIDYAGPYLFHAKIIVKAKKLLYFSLFFCFKMEPYLQCVFGIIFFFVLNQHFNSPISQVRALAIALGNIDPISGKQIGNLSDFAVSLFLI